MSGRTDMIKAKVVKQ